MVETPVALGGATAPFWCGGRSSLALATPLGDGTTWGFGGTVPAESRDMEPLLHAANVLFLLSYTARDVLWLRLLTFLGLGVVVGLQLSTPSADLIPVYWNATFMAVNAVHIAMLLWQRRPLQMTPAEADLRDRVFSGLSDQQFASVMRLASWADVHAGGSILGEGDRSGKILLLAQGKAIVAKRGVPLADVDSGAFVGEIGFLTGRPTVAAVIALEDSTCAWWQGDALRNLMRSDPNLEAAVKGILGVDVALKLRSAA